MAKPEWLPQGLYQWVKPRSLGLHFLFLAIAAGCGIAGWWQLNRALQGNTLSYLYTLEWPAFAVVAGIGWWKMFHDTPDDIAERKAFHHRMRAASAEVVARTLPLSARTLAVGSEEVDGGRLGAGEARAELLSGASGAGAGADIEAAGSESADPPGADLVRAGMAPRRRRDGEVEMMPPEPDPGEEDADEMTHYNRYLALLAIKGKAKTWRNPHGL